MEKGLGDTIAKITKKTGIKKIVEVFSKVTGLDCGCDKRQEKWNKLFPYKINCLSEIQYKNLDLFFKENPSVVNFNNQKILLEIYNSVFNKRQAMTTCSSCWRNILNDLKSVYYEY